MKPFTALVLSWVDLPSILTEASSPAERRLVTQAGQFTQEALDPALLDHKPVSLFTSDHEQDGEVFEDSLEEASGEDDLTAPAFLQDKRFVNPHGHGSYFNVAKQNERWPNGAHVPLPGFPGQQHPAPSLPGFPGQQHPAPFGPTKKYPEYRQTDGAASVRSTGMSPLVAWILFSVLLVLILGCVAMVVLVWLGLVFDR